MQTFTKKIPEIRHENYWQRLKLLKMNYQQRRYERYRIIYIWKMLEGRVPNCGVKINSNQEGRRGRLCEVPPVSRTATARVKSLREATLQVHGVRLFNCLPAELRNITQCSDIQFKEKLDKFLTNIPDQPMTGGLMPHVIDPVTGRHSNSLLDQVREHLRT